MAIYPRNPLSPEERRRRHITPKRLKRSGSNDLVEKIREDRRGKARRVKVREEYKLDKTIPFEKIVIYTTIYGSYDELKIQPAFKDVKYVCFTDNPKLKCDGWTIIFDDKTMRGYSSVLKAKYYKIMFHKFFNDVDYTFYIDASVQIRHQNFIQILLNYLTDNGIASYIHPKRKCIYEESQRIKSLPQYDNIKQNVDKQMNFYGNCGMPANYGLWANGILIRKRTPNSIKICELWWKEILQWHYRDQLSLPFILWKHDLKIDTINLKQYAGQLFKINIHTHEIGAKKRR